jgi:hypothetical protein
MSVRWRAIPQSRGALAPGKRPGSVAPTPIQLQFAASMRRGGAKLSLSRPSGASARNTSFAVDVDQSTAPSPQIGSEADLIHIVH